MKIQKIVLCCVILISSISFAEELNVKMKCTNGKCVPISNIDTTKLQRDVNNANKKVNDLLNKTEIKNGSLDDIQYLKEELKKLRFNLEQLSNRSNMLLSFDYQMKENIVFLYKQLGEQFKKIDQLEQNIKNQEKINNFKQNKLENKINTMRNKVSISTYFLGLYSFGVNGGLAFDFSLPVDLWNVGLTFGAGLNSDVGFGWFTKLFYTRKLDKLFIGPTVLLARNEYNFLDNSNWFLGFGLDVKYYFGSLFIGLNPLVGITTAKVGEQVCYSAKYSNSQCGLIETQSAYCNTGEQVKDIKFTGGGLAQIGFSF